MKKKKNVHSWPQFLENQEKSLHGRLGKHGHVVFCCFSHQEVDSVFLPLDIGLSWLLVLTNRLQYKLCCVVLSLSFNRPVASAFIYLESWRFHARKLGAPIGQVSLRERSGRRETMRRDYPQYSSHLSRSEAVLYSPVQIAANPADTA